MFFILYFLHIHLILPLGSLHKFSIALLTIPLQTFTLATLVIPSFAGCVATIRRIGHLCDGTFSSFSRTKSPGLIFEYPLAIHLLRC